MVRHRRTKKSGMAEPGALSLLSGYSSDTESVNSSMSGTSATDRLGEVCELRDEEAVLDSDGSDCSDVDA